jgi:DNA-binding SARP family transcriptional activator
LRQALWQLHTALHPGYESRDDEVLTVEGDTISVNPHADLWLDVDVFERAYAQARGQQGRELDPTGFDLLRSAADLYRDDLLTGWYQDWCLSERERLQNIYLNLLDKLMGFAEAGRLFEDSIYYGNRILQLDRARERTHAALMRAHYLAGDRTAALRQYERCVAALAEDLGVRPARRTTALYEQLCAEPTASATAAPTGGSWQRLLDQLHALESSLDAARQQVQQVQQDLHSLRKATGRPD